MQRSAIDDSQTITFDYRSDQWIESNAEDCVALLDPSADASSADEAIYAHGKSCRFVRQDILVGDADGTGGRCRVVWLLAASLVLSLALAVVPDIRSHGKIPRPEAIVSSDVPEAVALKSSEAESPGGLTLQLWTPTPSSARDVFASVLDTYAARQPRDDRSAAKQISITTTTSTSPSISTAVTTATTATVTASVADPTMWQVVFKGPINVRTFPSLEAPIDRVEWRCAELRGRRVQDWLEIVDLHGNANGYARMVVDKDVLLEEKQWQCVEYARGRDASWCKHTDIWEDHEIEYFGGKGSPCGGCWCCKRPVQAGATDAVVRRLPDGRDNSSAGVAEQLLDIANAAWAATSTCQPCSDMVRCSGMAWQILREGPVMVFPEADNMSDPSGLGWKCDIVQGYRMGDWLKITDGEPGYVQIRDAEGVAVAESTAQFPEEAEECAPCTEGSDTSCLESRCCKTPGHKCYQKNDYWATCKHTCTPNDQDRCDHLGYRSWTPRLPGFPTLYCWQLARPDTYEGELVRAQIRDGAGIFACDGFDVFAAQGDLVLGTLPDGSEVRTIYSEPHEVGRSKDGTAANTEVFYSAWIAIRDRGAWSRYAWVIKMDPDAVLVPDRIRIRIMQRWFDGYDKRCFFRTCNRFPDNPDFPMMYGAMELLSHAALDTFFTDGYKCIDWFPVRSYGEDLFLTKCLQKMGVEAVDDYQIVGDDRCMDGACWDHTYAAFHEYKDVDGWMRCWHETSNGSI